MAKPHGGSSDPNLGYETLGLAWTNDMARIQSFPDSSTRHIYFGGSCKSDASYLPRYLDAS